MLLYKFYKDEAEDAYRVNIVETKKKDVKNNMTAELSDEEINDFCIVNVKRAFVYLNRELAHSDVKPSQDSVVIVARPEMKDKIRSAINVIIQSLSGKEALAIVSSDKNAPLSEEEIASYTTQYAKKSFLQRLFDKE